MCRYCGYEISGFRGEYFFLSNFYPCRVEYEGLVFNCAEAAFQAAKTEDLEIRKQFCGLSGAEARELGRCVILRRFWELVKDDIMYEVVKAKFVQNPDLARKLMATGCALLYEENDWGDQYWGICNGRGLNRLGHILARVRGELREETITKRIAIIGTRQPSLEMAVLCKKIAVAFRDLNCGLVTGNADGIDSIAQRVWNEIHRERVTLVLPWPNFNNQHVYGGNRLVYYKGQPEWAASVTRYHPAPDRLSEAVFKLHARNYGIVEMADAVIAFPRDGREGGGTGQGIRVARALGKPLFVLPGDLERLRGFYRSLRASLRLG